MKEMDLQVFSSSKWPELVTHHRHKSFPYSRGTEEDNLDQSAEAANQQKSDKGRLNGCTSGNEKHSTNTEIQHSLRQEISLLEQRLHDQVSVRCALETAMGYKDSSRDITNVTAIPKPAIELIKEIAVLEHEVGHLEQHLLSLYRKAFEQQTTPSSPSKKCEGLKSPLSTSRRRLDFSGTNATSAKENLAREAETPTLSHSRKEANVSSEEKLVDSSVQRSQSSLSHRFALDRFSPPDEDVDRAVRACHSQPLSLMEYAQNYNTNAISLAEHLGTRISDHIPATPNELSEEMIKCMSNIFCKLADHPLANHGHSSPISSLLCISPKSQHDLWSPGYGNDSSFDYRLDNPFHVEGLKDFSGPYSTMVEVNCIHRDSKKLADVEYLLQNFRSLISRLEEVDPKKMSREEKLAFWINVHNALVMHAFLSYGIPQNNMKRMLLLLKAAYNVGGQIVSADAMQNSILGCRMSRPAQWLRFLLSSKTKFKAGDERQAYAIGHHEPLLYFALSSGSHSDPAVRVYTPKKVYQELESAKEAYIRATFGVRKDKKILLPKIVESFAKVLGLSPAGIVAMVQQCLPDSLRKSIEKRQLGKSQIKIEWVSHNFGFRYIISKNW